MTQKHLGTSDRQIFQRSCLDSDLDIFFPLPSLAPLSSLQIRLHFDAVLFFVAWQMVDGVGLCKESKSHMLDGLVSGNTTLGRDRPSEDISGATLTRLTSKHFISKSRFGLAMLIHSCVLKEFLSHSSFSPSLRISISCRIIGLQIPFSRDAPSPK